MKIMPISESRNSSRNNISFKSVYFEDFNYKFQPVRTRLQQEVEKFASSGSNVSELGSGKFGDTYRFKAADLRNYVIKRSKKSYKDDYEQEYRNLVQVPTDRIGGQAGVARVFNYDTSEYYLISTMAEGKEVSSFNRYTDRHLKSLFDKMFELDKVGIYHGDLNGKNILLTNSGDINFIDYQWTQILDNKSDFFSKVKSDKISLPVNHFPENAQMFEMATMPYYIESIGSKKEKEDFLRMYLKNKAEYHSKRYDYIKQATRRSPYIFGNNAREAIETELAKSKIYKNPSDNVLRIELKKLQFLSDYRDAFGHVDPNMLDRNILASSSSYLCAISAVQDFRKEVATQMRTCYDSDMNAYLKTQLVYGNYWLNNLEEWSSSTFEYVMRAITKQPNYDEEVHKFYIEDRNPRVIRQNKDILEVVDSKFHTSYDREFYTPYDVTGTMHDIYSSPLSKIKSEVRWNIKGINQHKKIRHAYKELKDCDRAGKTLDLLNTAQLMSLKTQEFYSFSRHKMSSYRLTSMLDDMRVQSVEFTESLFNTMLNGLRESNPRNILVQGYQNMRKFITKL